MPCHSSDVWRPWRLCLAIAIFTGCRADGTVRNELMAPQISASAQQLNSASFAFDADVSVSGVVDPTFRVPGAPNQRGSVSPGVSAAATAPTRTSVFAYHIAYSDSGGRIVVDLTPPNPAAAPAEGREMQQTSIWSHIRHIRYRSDAAAPEVTLASGRIVSPTVGVPDVGTGAPTARPGGRDALSETPERRARRLQGMIAPLVRIRAQSALRIPGLASANAGDSVASRRSAWTRASEDFDVVQRREIDRPAGTNGRMRSLALEVTNARLSGTPSTHP